jgi:hypothetical protein
LECGGAVQLTAGFDIVVNGTRCEPIDPLFLTPKYRWYDLDADRAQAFDPMQVEVKDRETKGNRPLAAALFAAE